MVLGVTATNNSSCFDFSDSPAFVGVIAAQAGCSLISIMAVLLMIALGTLFRKYRCFTQRLILYLAVAVLVKSVVEATNVVSYWSGRSLSLHSWCVTVAFLQQVTVWWVILATTWIMVDIFVKVKYNGSMEACELVSVGAIVLTPIVVTSWVPFVFDAYGPVGPVCWIRNKELDNGCATFLPGAILQIALYLGPAFVVIALILVLLIASLILLRQQSRLWVGKYDPVALDKKKQMKTEIQPLLAYPVILLMTHAPLTGGFVAGSIGTSSIVALILWYFIAPIYHLQGIFLVCAFSLDPETRRKLTKADLLAAIRNCRWKKHHVVRDYPAEANCYEESVPTDYVNYENT